MLKQNKDFCLLLLTVLDFVSWWVLTMRYIEAKEMLLDCKKDDLKL